MKIKKRTLKIILVLLVLVILIYFIYPKKVKDPYEFKENSLSYSQNRGSPDFNISLNKTNENITIYNINFQSKPFLDNPTRIYGLLFIPKSENPVSALAFLPAGGGTKEVRYGLAESIAEQGIAVLIIDQRGIGQTGGIYLGPEQDYPVFAQGKEPIQHLSVFDALKSFDVLQKIKEVDKNNIGLAGESMGARYAIIATALDQRIKGVIIISSSGFNIVSNPSLSYNSYLLSIDPDQYISKISPRSVFMLQGNNDSVVPLASAQHTFGLARDPKRFFIAEGCNHGYCVAMENELKTDLQILFKK